MESNADDFWDSLEDGSLQQSQQSESGIIILDEMEPIHASSETPARNTTIQTFLVNDEPIFVGHSPASPESSTPPGQDCETLDEVLPTKAIEPTQNDIEESTTADSSFHQQHHKVCLADSLVDSNQLLEFKSDSILEGQPHVVMADSATHISGPKVSPPRSTPTNPTRPTSLYSVSRGQPKTPRDDIHTNPIRYKKALEEKLAFLSKLIPSIHHESPISVELRQMYTSGKRALQSLKHTLPHSDMTSSMVSTGVLGQAKRLRMMPSSENASSSSVRQTPQPSVVYELSSEDDSDNLETALGAASSTIAKAPSRHDPDDDEELTDVEEEPETRFYSIYQFITRHASFTEGCKKSDTLSACVERKTGGTLIRFFSRGGQMVGVLNSPITNRLAILLESSILRTETSVSAPAIPRDRLINIQIDIWGSVKAHDQIVQLFNGCKIPLSDVKSYISAPPPTREAPKPVHRPLFLEGRFQMVSSNISAHSSELEKALAGFMERDYEKMKTAPQPENIGTALLLHQLQALQWMLDQEDESIPITSENPRFLWKAESLPRNAVKYVHMLDGFTTLKKPVLPRGGILADEMGLGKTLTTIALIMADRMKCVKEAESKPPSGNRPGSPTLVVCPVSVMSNWQEQINRHVQNPHEHMRTLVYHGQGRAVNAEVLCEYDVVITTYSTLQKEFLTTKNKHDDEILEQTSPLLQAEWHRVILDEAHFIKNKSTKQNRACVALRSARRWCLTGTPIQNNLEDMFSLMCFIKIEPLNNRQFWGKMFGKSLHSSSSRSIDQLKAISTAVCLRRTKDQTMFGKPLLVLPPKSIVVQYMDFTSDEMFVYRQTFNLGKKIYESFVRSDSILENYSHILVLLLRIRQACDHFSLLPDSIKSAVSKSDAEVDYEKLEEAMSNLDSEREAECPLCMVPDGEKVLTKCRHTFCVDCYEKMREEAKSIKCPFCRKELEEDEIFRQTDQKQIARFNPESIRGNFQSTKLSAIRDILSRRPPGRKTVIFSQWTAMLNLIGATLDLDGIRYKRLDGSMDARKRTDEIDSFQNNPTFTVILISLTAGGVGLNLTAASQVIVVDPWWNPATEAQAIDRVHRLGQTEDVDVIRLIMKDSIEDRILSVQRAKNSAMSAAFGKISQAELQKQRIEGLRFLFSES